MENYTKIILFLSSFITILPEIAFPQNRPPLFFRENWKEIPAETPITQNHVSNPDLNLNLYGTGKDSLKKSHHEKPIDDPYYVWSGLCTGNWAVTIKHKNNFVDLTSLSKIKWRSKQSGFRNLHIVLKLADGNWLISKQVDGSSRDWRIIEFNISDINWYKININTMTEGKVVENPDLSKVDEVGFTDLMRGGGSLACSRVDWIEIYGRPVVRK
jgi:hypothetical protein